MAVGSISFTTPPNSPASVYPKVKCPHPLPFDFTDHTPLHCHGECFLNPVVRIAQRYNWTDSEDKQLEGQCHGFLGCVVQLYLSLVLIKRGVEEVSPCTSACG